MYNLVSSATRSAARPGSGPGPTPRCCSTGWLRCGRLPGRLSGMFAFARFGPPPRAGSPSPGPARHQAALLGGAGRRATGGLLGAARGCGRCSGERPPIDHTAIVASLLYYWIPEDHCVYQGVHKLPPGSWLEVGPDGRRRQGRFFDPRAELAAPSGRQVDVEELRRLLEDSVAAHLVADVPISTFLSGGLDSSLLTVLAARHNRDIDCYTISFRPEDRRLEAMPDDLAYARKLAGQHGIRLHEVEIAPDVADLLPRMVHMLDEPIGDAAAINTYLICRAARQAGVKVLLSGMGADELFGGYRKHYAGLLAARYRRLPGVLRHRVVAPAVERLPVAGRRRGYRAARWAKRFVAFADLPEEAAFRRSYTHYDVGELHELLDPELWPRVDQLVEEHAAVYDEGPADDQVNRMCYTDTRLFLTGLNLAYTDRASMAASTEVRVPYVDKEVAAAAFAIPGRAKIVGRERKAILKQAAEAWLPREIVYRPKGLFSAPLRAWIRRDLADMVEDLVAGGTLVTSGLVDKQMVRTMIDETASAPSTDPRRSGSWSPSGSRPGSRAATMQQIARESPASGELAVLEVPVPGDELAGGRLVRPSLAHLDRTRSMKIAESKLWLVGKARARPDHVNKVMRSVSSRARATYRKVRAASTPIRRSATRVRRGRRGGRAVEELTVGQRVGLCREQYALHAEFNWVPRDLCVPPARSIRL